MQVSLPPSTAPVSSPPSPIFYFYIREPVPRMKGDLDVTLRYDKQDLFQKTALAWEEARSIPVASL